MTPQQYSSLREAYLAVQELPPEQRRGYLERTYGGDPELRGQLESLLAEGEHETAFLGVDGRDATAAALRPAEAPSPELPERIGAFRPIRLIGEGGMGLVYEAEQERPRRRVALKVMRPGSWSPKVLRRFEHEGQILALLQHPGIAQIYEIGTFQPAGGGRSVQPFFAMELVAGQALTEFARARELSVRKRLELMASVCDAVQHAHQRGVIHRDLKPANILVVDGVRSEPPTPVGGDVSAPQTFSMRETPRPRGRGSDALPQSAIPKILDFGVARVTDADVQLTTLQTDVGQVIGTLAYMSPEQVAGDSAAIDTRSDVYSLGVTLYELLCGQLPYEITRSSLARAAQVIREQAPRRLSVVNRALRGDLETIVLKALEKDRERRYQSALEIGQDIRRFLADEPITARPPTLTYQLRKLVARHKAVSTLLGVLLTALVTFSVAVSVLYVRANRDRERAEEAEGNARAQAETATRVAASMMDLFGSLDPFASAGSDVLLGASLSPDEILDRAAATISGQLAEQPETRVTLLNRLVGVNINRGRHALAEELARGALEAARKHLGEEHALVAKSLRTLARALTSGYRFEEAEPLHQASLAMLRRLLGDHHPDVAMSLFLCGDLARTLGDAAAAEKMLREALSIVQTGGATEELSAGHVLRALAAIQREKGEFAQAQALCDEALNAFRVLTGEHGPDSDVTRVNMAILCRSQGDLTGAEKLLREVVAEQRARHGDRTPSLASVLADLGETLRLRGDFDDAETCLRDALAILRQSLGERNPQVTTALSYLAALMQDKGELAAAEELRRQHLRLAGELFAPDTAPVLSAADALAALLIRQSKFDQAELVLRPALESSRRTGLDRMRVYQVSAAQSLAGILVRQGKLDEAEQLAHEALDSSRGTPGGDRWPAEEIDALMLLGNIHNAKGDFAAAQRRYEEARLICRDRLGARWEPTTDALIGVGGALWLQGEHAAAKQPLREALAIHLELHPRSEQAANAQSLLGLVMMASGDPATAPPMFEQAAETWRVLRGATHPSTQLAIFHQVLALQAAGQTAAAEPLIDEMFTVQEQLLLSGQPDIGSLHNLVLALHAQGDFARAASLVEPVASLYEHMLSRPEDHPDRSGAPLLLGLLHMGQGDPAAAEPLLREVVDLRTRCLAPGERKWLTAYAESVLGECLTRSRHFDEAEPLLLEAFQTLRHDRGEGHQRTFEALQRLVHLYEQWNKPESAREYRALLPVTTSPPG